jgi:hypothetical protein
MKNTLFAFLFFVAIFIPSLSHAQTYFGGRFDTPFPLCDCTPVAIDFSSAYEAACSGVSSIISPIFFFDIFAPLWIGSTGPTGGFLAIPIDTVLAFPNFALVPEEWALGSLAPGATAVCGLTLPIVCFEGGYPYPAIMCMPIPLQPLYGIITPATGAAPGGFF